MTHDRSIKILAIVVLLAAISLSKFILMPILVAGLLALFASPLVSWMASRCVPKWISSLLVMSGLIAVFTVVFSAALTPALDTIESAPVIGDRLLYELDSASKDSVIDLEKFQGGEQNFSDSVKSSVVKLTTILAGYTFTLLVQLSIIWIMTYFFLTFGEDLLRTIISSQSKFSEKRLTVTLFSEVRSDLSHYLFVVSLINVGLGLTVALALYAIGFPNPFLWGTLVTVFNYAPYVGPISVAVMLGAVGFAEGQHFAQYIIAPSLFLVINLVESQFVTPSVLGHKFRINPILVVSWMFFWGWLWGASGLLLAIPILVCAKIISHHTNLLGEWGALLEMHVEEDGNHGQKTFAQKYFPFRKVLKEKVSRASNSA